MKLILSLVSDRVLPDRDYPAQSASPKRTLLNPLLLRYHIVSAV